MQSIQEQEEQAKIMLDKLNAVFLLAGIEVKRFHRLPNGYCSDHCCPHRPWMLAETKFGSIKIGWRKRVISIEWTNDIVDVHGKTVLAEGDEIVTNWETGVHAWGYAKAITQLQTFVEVAERFLYNKEADSRLTAPELEEYRTLMEEHKAKNESKYAPQSPRLKELEDKRMGKVKG